MNHIEKVRAEILQYFDPQKLVEDSFDTTFSPDKSFRLRTSRYRQNKPELNWYVTNVEVFDNRTGEELFNFLANDAFFHAWLRVGGRDLLVGAEDMYGGQTRHRSHE